MIMAGLEFTNQIPFQDVCFHGMIRDEKGRKMSKSLGNSPEPIDLINKFGADAIRFGMLLITPRDRDVLFAEERIEVGRNFANKLWNSGRFLWLNTKGITPDLPKDLTLIDKWIISKFKQLIISMEKYMSRYELNQAAKDIYEFTWHQFCDWYVEYMKAEAPRRQSVYQIGLLLFKNFLILLHPYMPFITEELYQRLGFGSETIWHEKWPDLKLFKESDSSAVDLFFGAIESIRNLRSAWRIPANRKVDCILNVEDPDLRKIIEANNNFLKSLAMVDTCIFDKKPQKPFSSTILKGATIYLPLSDSVDIEKEIKRLQDELDFLENRIEEIGNRLNDDKFQKMASEEIRLREATRLEDFSKKRDDLNRLLKEIRE